MARILNSARMLSNIVDVPAASGLYQRIIQSFPDGIQMAFAYGSGVIQQQGHKDPSANMIDFIFVVDQPKTWHQENIKRNSKHYSFLKYLGSKNVTRIQTNYGARVYFNTLVPFENRIIKYGVISTDNLILDLLDWDSLYVSGRLHKPVKLICLPTSTELCSAMQINLQSALHSAFLLLPEKFTEEELYLKIAGLSYNGDFRMTIGEDKNKVANIVKPNVPYFRHLYEHLIDNEEHVFWNKSNGTFEQYPNHVSQFHHLNLLPKAVQFGLFELHIRNHLGKIPDMEEVIRTFAFDSFCDKHVAKSISKIVAKSSWSQSIKSAFTAGIMKSVKYSMKKLQKMIKSQRK